MQFTIRLDWQKWERDPRAQAMFAQLPFGMDIPIALMLDNWWMIREQPFPDVHCSIIDGLDEYQVEDAIGEMTYGEGNYNPSEIYQQHVEPYHDLLVEIVYELFQQSFTQLLPLFNSQHNIGQFAVSLVHMYPMAVVIEFAEPVMANAVASPHLVIHSDQGPIQPVRLTEMIRPPETSFL